MCRRVARTGGARAGCFKTETVRRAAIGCMVTQLAQRIAAQLSMGTRCGFADNLPIISRGAT
ncbi:hypothetical protein OH687_22955 [Burkholderia anthina]|nr:hypothetical protein OH687_22955 [Burkholderia anthina]